MKIKKMIFMAILTAESLLLFLIESLIPMPFAVPGAKIGLSNIITVISLYMFGFKDSLIIICLKVILSSFFSGTLSTFLFSICGGLLSLIAMYTVKRAGGKNISIIGVSVTGSVFHNLAQITVASIIIKSTSIFAYTPYLLIAALAAGIFVGLVSLYLLNHLRKIKFIYML